MSDTENPEPAKQDSVDPKIVLEDTIPVHDRSFHEPDQDRVFVSPDTFPLTPIQTLFTPQHVDVSPTMQESAPRHTPPLLVPAHLRSVFDGPTTRQPTSGVADRRIPTGSLTQPGQMQHTEPGLQFSGYPAQPVQRISGYPEAPRHAASNMYPQSFVPSFDGRQALPMPNVSRSSTKHEHISILNPGEPVPDTTSNYRMLNRDPPVFDGTSYTSWRKRLFLWVSMTRTHPSQVAPLIYDNTTGLGRTVIESVGLETILDNRPDPTFPDQTRGLAAILRVFDESFDVTGYNSPHVAFTSLMEFKRKPSDSWLTYLATFQAKVRDVMKAGHKIDNTFVSYLLIQNSGMTEEDRKVIFSSLEGKQTPFHTASLEQVIGTIKAVLIQSKTDTGTDDHDAYMSKATQRKFYRPDKQVDRRTPQQSAQQYGNDTYPQRPWEPRNHPWNDQGQRQQYGDQNQHPSYNSDRYGNSNFRSQRGKGKGKSKNNRNKGKGKGRFGNQQNWYNDWDQTDFRRSQSRDYRNDQPRRKGKGKGKGYNRAYCAEDEDYAEFEEPNRCECQCKDAHCSIAQPHQGQSSTSSRAQKNEEILFNAAHEELSDGSDYGFDCTRNLHDANELFNASSTATSIPLVDHCDDSETRIVQYRDDVSEISDVDIEDLLYSTPVQPTEEDEQVHEVFGISRYGPTDLFQSEVRLNSFEDEDMNPLTKPSVRPERKSVYNSSTMEMQYPTDQEAREIKETVLDHYVYNTEKGTRRKYIAKGTTAQLGNIKDSPVALIDSGCTTNIGSSNFLAKYEAFLKQIGEKREIVKKNSTTKFRFANGTYGNAVCYAEIPVVIGNKRTYLGLHVLPQASADLLLSFPSATRMGMNINFKTNSVSLPDFGIDNFQVPVANSHMYFPIYWFGNYETKSFRILKDRYEKNGNEVSEVLKVAKEPLDETDRFCLTKILPEIMLTEAQMTEPKFLLKIHLQYGHRSAEKLYKMLYFACGKKMPAGLTLQKIRDVLSKCPVCSQLRPKPVVPKFGGLIAEQFNEIVTIDLVEMPFRGNKVHIVAHLIDIHSRLSYAEIIPSKEGIHIVDFLMAWQMRAGRPPRHLLSDRGTEFANEMCEQFCSTNGTRFHTTLQALHPEQNGINERRNQTLKRKLSFIVADMVSENARFSFSPRYLLDMVLFSINSQVGDAGYSPFQIAFTQPTTIWLLSTDTHPPSTWVDRVDNFHPLIADRMTLQMKTSAAIFSQMLMKQLAKAWKSRIYQKNYYQNGESVYYWKRDPKYRRNGYYLGPCTVLDKKGKTYVLEYGSKARRIGQNEIVAKQQLYPEEYLDLFDPKSHAAPKEPEKSADTEPDSTEEPAEITKLFSDALDDEYDRMIVETRAKSTSSTVFEPQRVGSPLEATPDSDIIVRTHPSTPNASRTSRACTDPLSDKATIGSRIIEDVDIDDLHQFLPIDMQLPEQSEISATAPLTESPIQDMESLDTTVRAASFQTPTSRERLSHAGNTNSSDAASSRRRRANPLLKKGIHLSQNTPRSDASTLKRIPTPSPESPAAPLSDQRQQQSSSPYPMKVARKLMFGLPDDYLTPESPPRSIFEDNTRVRFNLQPDVLEYNPQQANLCTVIDRVSNRHSVGYTTVYLDQSMHEFEKLRTMSDLLELVDVDTTLEQLSTVEEQEALLDQSLPKSHQILEFSDNWFEELIENVFQAQIEQPMSAYREPTKEELRKFKSNFDASKLKEIQSWIDNGVFRIQEQYSFEEGDNLVTSRWLQNVKTYPSGEICKFKSRLIIRGFQDAQLMMLKKDSPTVAKTSVRLLLCFAVQNSFDVYSADVSTAFLQGENYKQEDNRKVYVRVPKGTNELIGVPESAIWILNKSAYGLCDAPYKWYSSLLKTLIKAGMHRSLSDFSMFYYKRDGKLLGMVVTHVDDILYCGTDQFRSEVISQVKNQYKFGSESVNSFQYCGAMIAYDKDEERISVGQEHYTKSIVLPKLDAKYPSEDHLMQEHFNSFRSVLGKLSWLANSSRPDLSFGVNSLAQIMQNPTYADYSTLQKLLKTAKLYSTIGLEFIPLDPGNPEYLLVYSDASHAHFCKDGRYHSQTGTLVYLATQNASHEWKMNLIDWASKKQKRICRSTLCCEALAAGDSIDRALSIRDTYHNLHGITLPVVLLTDCKSLATTSTMTTNVSERRLQIDIGAIRELVDRNEVRIVHVTTDNMLADCLTKPMSLTALQRSISSHSPPNSLSLQQQII